MTPSPAPALLPLPRSLRTPRRSAPRESGTMEAPSGYDVQLELLLARVTIRGVAGVSSAAVAEYVAILQRDLAGAARLARLNAPTLPAPPAVDFDAPWCLTVNGPMNVTPTLHGDGFAAYYERNHLPDCLCTACDPKGEREWHEGWVETSNIESTVLEHVEEHPRDCTDPCCVPEDEHDLYCVDEGSHLLADPSGLYGVRGVL